MATTDTSIAYRNNGLERLRPFAIVFSSAAISAASIATAIMANGLTEAGWRTAVQYSGRVAVLLFLLPFLAGPVARMNSSRGLMIDRRAYGLGFAAAFALYLATVIAPYVLAHIAIPATVLAVSAIGGILLAFQIVTSNAFAIRKLGFRAWSKLHAFAMYAYWTAFTVGFLDRAVGPSRPDNFVQIGLCLMIAALLIRFAASFAAKRGWVETAR